MGHRCRKQNSLDDILHVAKAEMLGQSSKRGDDPSGYELEKSEHIRVPGSIDGGGPQDDQGKLLPMGQGKLLSHPLTLPIGRNRTARVRLRLLFTSLAGA